MTQSGTDPADFSLRYESALKNCFSKGGEDALSSAYELGHQALESGLGLLEVASFHRSAVAAALREQPADGDLLLQRFDAAGNFLSEILAPFELIHRGNQETNSALRRLNGILEEEAKRIAHALHDEAGELLATVYLELAELAREPTGPVATRVSRITGYLDRMREQLRRLSHELRPPILDQLGLVPALRFLADGVAKRTGIQVVVEDLTESRLPLQAETSLYRVVQEALTNVTKHARATRVYIRVWIDNGIAFCAVRDDGIGFESAGTKTTLGLGLIGIRERVTSLHGTLKIDSAPGKGTEIRVSLPINGI
jgi:signal transduction histidine kinase